MVALDILHAEHRRVEAATGSTDVGVWTRYVEQHPELELHKIIFREDVATAAWERRLDLYRGLVKRFEIEIVRHDGQTIDVSEYISKPNPGQRARSYVPREAVANQEQLRLELSIEAVKACITRIKNLGFVENDVLVAHMLAHVERLEARLEAVLRPKKRGMKGRPKRDGEQPAA